jgi:hypothetical protein
MVRGSEQYTMRGCFMKREEIERLAFLYLCKSTDRAYVNGESKMALRDFERLTYIAFKLGFLNLEIGIWRMYAGKKTDAIEQWMNAYEVDGISVEESVKEEVEKHEEWLKGFCESAPTKRIRGRLMEVFDVEI